MDEIKLGNYVNDKGSHITFFEDHTYHWEEAGFEGSWKWDKVSEKTKTISLTDERTGKVEEFRVNDVGNLEHDITGMYYFQPTQ